METLAQKEKIDVTHLAGMIASNKAESQELGACDANDFTCSKATVQTKQTTEDKKEQPKESQVAPEPSVNELKNALKSTEIEAQTEKKMEKKADVKVEQKKPE